MRTRASIITVLSVLLSWNVMAADSHTLTINIDNIQDQGGTLYLSVYNTEESYDSNSQAVTATSKDLSGSALSVTIPSLPAGKYAIKFFIDSNANKRIDFGPQGIPTEQYGFSNNGGTFGPPSFAEASIDLNGDTGIEIHAR